MSFISQNIKNRFPEWSKVKRDSSSNTSIILDAIGEEIEELRISGYALKLQQKNLLSHPFFEEEKMYKFNLLKDENFPIDFLNKSITSIILSKGSDSIPVETFWSDYCFEYADSFRFNKEEEELRKELKGNINEEIELKKPEQLYIILENVKRFKDSNDVEAGIIIRGINPIDNEVEEYIPFSDLKTYKTKNYFKRIKTLQKATAT